MFGVFGINFPVGVLLYWLVSNFWSMGQQLYVIRRMPAVGSPAYEALMKRKEKRHPGAAAAADKTAAPAAGAGSNGAAPEGGGGGAKTVRQQPQRQTRSQRGPKKR
jgi:YidC/Oxa1 family membrane protein insertase